MKFLKKREDIVCFACICILLAFMPILLNYGVLSSSSIVLFLGKCIAFAIAAIGIDLIWGYTGILSLGHGLYFALGGYAMAMYLKLQSTGGKITDFMHTGGMTSLPLIWKPFLSLPAAMLLMILVPGGIAAIVGYFIFKNRVKGVYFSIISQALAWAAYSIFIALSPYTNGNVGITEIKSVFGGIKGPSNQRNMFLLFYASLLLMILIFAFCRFLAGRKFGKILVAIRDGENRAYFSGYQVSKYKTFVYVLSAILAAIGGAVFANFNGSITPSQMTISYSITMVIWVAIGGRGTIIGAVIGAFLVNLCEYSLSSGGLVEIWQYIIGAVFCITIIFFKGGITGLVSKYFPIILKKLSKQDNINKNIGKIERSRAYEHSNGS
ncbi:MAG: urea transport system permease protein [Clostridiales bacterium]|jgi:urea transport system permease protein|nr:urea transporter, permease protein UrtC [Oscillospiraceae bacterium]MDN5378863.1 urea transport system permease protein [Clostridiales bacterium]